MMYAKPLIRNCLSFLAGVGILWALHAQCAEVRVEVDGGKPMHTMRGGLGASWHAIEKPMPVTPGGDPHWGGCISHGGSGWGANPPAEDDKAWQEIARHADWLGFDWCRVELEQRMYEPERNQFDWDNAEMQLLYRMLDWCERRHCDVFLTQMWANVAWNAMPELRNNPTDIVHSGPASLDDFAEGLATLVEHLVKTKKYTCIRWVCITNEPNYEFSWFQKAYNMPMPLTPALEAVRKSLDKRGIDIPLSAPDVGTPAFDPAKVDFQSFVGAYDLHDYYHDFDWKEGQQGKLARHVELVARFADWAHRQDKPFFLSEYSCFGTVGLPLAVRDAEMVIRDLSVGVDGFNRWSFLNVGNLDGQWQLLQTWDAANNKLLNTFTPYPNTYYFTGMLSRYTAKHSTVLSSRVEGGVTDPHQRVYAAALRSPKGQFTLLVVNDAGRLWDADVSLRALGSTSRFYRYDISQADRDRNDLTINPNAEFLVSEAAPGFHDTLKPESLTIYSTYRLSHTEPGITDDQ